MIVPVILSGGAGSRLWPVSRRNFPKPFITLPQGDTLIRRAYRRAVTLADKGCIVTVTHRDLAHLSAGEYEAADCAGTYNTLLLEAEGRETAAAVALAALHVAKVHGDDAVLVVLPADQLVTDEETLRQAVQEAARLAAAGRIVTFGIRPTRPETGFGYVMVADDGKVSFSEKPDIASARTLIETGRAYWNSGMFCFAAATMIRELGRWCPEVLAGAREALASARSSTAPGGLRIDLAKAPFAATPAISIDYAVMEKTDRLALVPCDCGWSDVGSWTAMSDLVEPDGCGNRLVGTIAQEGARNCFVQGSDRVVGLVGVEDLVVVDTPDALLVAHRDRAQDVRSVFARLKGEGHAAAELHRRVVCPWGTYTVLEEGPHYKIKRIDVKPGAALSLQAHRHRSEHWVVVSGVARVINGDREICLTPRQSTYIYSGNRHRLANPGPVPLVLIEVQLGDYLGEDDIVRFDDAYGRV